MAWPAASIRAQGIGLPYEVEQAIETCLEQLSESACDTRRQRLLALATEMVSPDVEVSLGRVAREKGPAGRTILLSAIAEPIAGISLIWPVPSGFTSKPGQDYAQFDVGSANRHHAGMDIPAPSGTEVVAAAGGTARVFRLVDFAEKTHCLGNVVIIDHNGVAATLYAHLQTISVLDGNPVSQGEKIGSVGNTVGQFSGGGSCVDEPLGPHLHFELKNNAVLGIIRDHPKTAHSEEGETWGYTPQGAGTPTSADHPDNWEFHDPILNLHSGITSTAEVTVLVTSLGSGVSMRTGPDADYRSIGSTLLSGQEFIRIGEYGAPTTSCSSGWYQIKNTNGIYFPDSIFPGGSLPEVWVCRGNGTEDWVAPKLVQTFPSAEIVNPEPGSNFATNTINFTWTNTGAPDYLLRIGTTPGGTDIFVDSLGPNTSVEVSGLPTDEIVYVALWTKKDDSASNSYWVKSYLYNQDLDNDGIIDFIDPNPSSFDGRRQFVGADYELTILGSGRVANLRVSPSIYDDLSVGTSGPHVNDLTQLVMGHFADVFDFIMFANDQENAATSIFGTYHSVKNDTLGLGAPTFDHTAAYGSAGRLQGVINFPRIGALRGGPSLHELLHRWAHYLNSVDTGASALGFGHWGFSSVGGQFGGWDPTTFVPLGEGNYQASNGQPGFRSFGLIANGGNSIPYSELELYLMGLIPPEQVPDIQIAQNPAWIDASNGTFSADGFTTVTASDILLTDGSRIPNHNNSQKAFRALYVVLSKGPLSNPQWAEYDRDAYDFSRPEADEDDRRYNFWEATGGRATLQMDGLKEAVHPQAMPWLKLLLLGD